MLSEAEAQRSHNAPINNKGLSARNSGAYSDIRVMGCSPNCSREAPLALTGGVLVGYVQTPAWLALTEVQR